MSDTSTNETRTSNREEADDYHSVIVILSNGWRVIECRDGIQWILQRSHGTRLGRPLFRSVRYQPTGTNPSLANLLAEDDEHRDF